MCYTNARKEKVLVSRKIVAEPNPYFFNMDLVNKIIFNLIFDFIFYIYLNSLIGHQLTTSV